MWYLCVYFLIFQLSFIFFNVLVYRIDAKFLSAVLITMFGFFASCRIRSYSFCVMLYLLPFS